MGKVVDHELRREAARRAIRAYAEGEGVPPSHAQLARYLDFEHGATQLTQWLGYSRAQRPAELLDELWLSAGHARPLQSSPETGVDPEGRARRKRLEAEVRTERRR